MIKIQINEFTRKHIKDIQKEYIMTVSFHNYFVTIISEFESKIIDEFMNLAYDVEII